MVLVEGDPLPVQVTWKGPGERHLRALDAFHETQPRSAEGEFVTQDRFEAGQAGFGKSGWVRLRVPTRVRSENR